MTAGEQVPVHLANAWNEALTSPQHWCGSCQEYRVRLSSDLCPVCADEKRRGATA